MQAPFPYFGGKRSVADVIWQRLGDVPNMIEPFFGSGAVLLARPPFTGRRTETVNDLDGYVANFWRALQHDPDAVAHWADWPVNEHDLQARHYWLVTEGRAILARTLGDAEGYDAKVAGWWCWGLCSWIGGGFCSGKGPWQWTGEAWEKQGSAGQGINRQLPHLGNAGQGINKAGSLHAMFAQLAERLRDVRVASGDWSRVCGPSVTDGRGGITGVFLDPPYANEGREAVYTHDNGDVATDCREWAIEAGRRPSMRICLAGYAHEHDMPEGWTQHRWKAQGGFGGQSDKQGRANSEKESLWFSPHCLPPMQERLL